MVSSFSKSLCSSQRSRGACISTREYTSSDSWPRRTPYQQLTHHAASGCALEVGDLIGTGTISGSGADKSGKKVELGCLYEAERLKQVAIPPGSGKYHDGYLDDGDEIILEAWCEDTDGKVVLGFGECRGRITPPRVDAPRADIGGVLPIMAPHRE